MSTQRVVPDLPTVECGGGKKKHKKPRQKHHPRTPPGYPRHGGPVGAATHRPFHEELERTAGVPSRLVTDRNMPLRAKVASSVSRTAAALSRAAGRGDGSVIGGWIGLKIDPDLLAHLAAG